MGCCCSKTLTFADISLADSVIPSSPPASGEYKVVKLIPEQGLVCKSVSIYLTNDTSGCPTYYIGNKIFANPIFRNKYNQTSGEYTSLEAMKIQQSRRQNTYPDIEGFESEMMRNVLPSFFQAVDIVTLDGFTVTMQKRIDAMSARSEVIGLDQNYSVKKDSLKRTVLSLNGSVVGYMYDNETEAMNETAFFTKYKEYISHLRAPVVLYVSKNLREKEMLRTIAILACANDRMVGCAQKEKSSGGTTNNDDFNDDF